MPGRPESIEAVLMHGRGGPFGRASKAIDLRIDGEEAEDVPQPQQEFADAVSNRPLAIDNRVPWWLIGVEVPSQRIGPKTIEDLVGTTIVAKLLRHLSGFGNIVGAAGGLGFFFGQESLFAILALIPFGEHQSQNDAVAEWMRVGFLLFDWDEIESSSDLPNSIVLIAN